MSTLVIRDARIEDAPILAQAERTIAERPGFLASRPHEINTEAFKKKIELLSKIPNGKYVVTEQNGRIVGHALLRLSRSVSLANSGSCVIIDNNSIEIFLFVKQLVQILIF